MLLQHMRTTELVLACEMLYPGGVIDKAGAFLCGGYCNLILESHIHCSCVSVYKSVSSVRSMHFLYSHRVLSHLRVNTS